ncbi:hypothetical protein LMG27198_06060 [Methylocystis echinoides]|uniref:Uncharacterized protein n=1 Tax=Methylocystis echinoides TaxID=29468 RepID=A0A9W6LQU6_9HYPH|nr:hypothetical protein LMG27198_06060 [Methylocystis echinoides]
MRAPADTAGRKRSIGPDARAHARERRYARLLRFEGDIVVRIGVLAWATRDWFREATPDRMGQLICPANTRAYPLMGKRFGSSCFKPGDLTET